MTDYISRADAIETVQKIVPYVIDKDTGQWGILVNKANIITELEALPSADATVVDYPNDLISRNALMEYCSNQKSKTIDNNDIARFPSADAVSREFYEDAVKANIGIVIENRELKEQIESADAVHGEWILVKGSNGKDYHKCSKCLHTQEITGVKNYCAVCGARMKGGAE